MSFFNLTHTGLQNPLKTVTDFEAAPEPISAASSAVLQPPDSDSGQENTPSDSGQENTPSESSIPVEVTTIEAKTNLEPNQEVEHSQKLHTLSHVEELYMRTSSRKDQPVYTSHNNYTEKHHKHQRNMHGPNELYKWPIATSQDYGRWMLEKKDTDKWSYQKRHANANSEMTRFVDDMGATNKEFTLF